MKRLIEFLIICIGLAAFISCSSSQRACGAYSLEDSFQDQTEITVCVEADPALLQ